jgi:hypothetical protein
MGALPFPEEPVGVKLKVSSSKLSSSKLREVGGGSGEGSLLGGGRGRRSKGGGEGGGKEWKGGVRDGGGGKGVERGGGRGEGEGRGRVGERKEWEGEGGVRDGGGGRGREREVNYKRLKYSPDIPGRYQFTMPKHGSQYTTNKQTNKQTNNINTSPRRKARSANHDCLYSLTWFPGCETSCDLCPPSSTEETVVEMVCDDWSVRGKGHPHEMLRPGHHQSNPLQTSAFSPSQE